MRILALYALIAGWTTWPLLASPDSALVIPESAELTVPLFNVWTMWWNIDRLSVGLSNYWHAPIFHPEASAFACSEPQFPTIALAPVLWFTGSRILTHNVWLWLSLLLNGLLTRQLLNALGLRRSIGVAGGIAMLLLPIVHWQMSVIQLVPVWGIVWTWRALLHVPTTRPETWWPYCEPGIAFSISFLICGHHGLFLAVLLTGTAWILPRSLKNRFTLTTVAVSTLATLILAGPMIHSLRKTAREHDFSRPSDVAARLSAQPSYYKEARGQSLFSLTPASRSNTWQLSPGWIKVALAGVGVVLGLCRKKRRRWIAFLLSTVVLAFLLSLGPNLWVGRWQPWLTLANVFPGLSQVRNVFRFAWFVQMAVVLLAMHGLHEFHIRLRTCGPRRLATKPIQALVCVVGLVAACEVLPFRPAIANMPPIDSNRDWIEFVRDNTVRGRSIACMPFSAGNGVKQCETSARWMYWQTFHGVPMVNGYSGFFPDSYFRLRDAINESFPDEDTLQQLAAHDVELIVIRHNTIPTETLTSGSFGTMGMKIAFSGSSATVYRLIDRRDNDRGPSTAIESIKDSSGNNLPDSK